jgi:hypothetical protein
MKHLTLLLCVGLTATLFIELSTGDNYMLVILLHASGYTWGALAENLRLNRL